MVCVVNLYTVERHVPGYPPARFEARPFLDACELALLIAWAAPVASVEVHGTGGLVGVVHEGAVRDPMTGCEL